MTLNIKKPYIYRIAVIWALALSLILFHQGAGGSIVSIDYFPAFPRYGEPLQLTVRLSNPDPEPRLLDVKIYVNGLAAAEMLTQIDGFSVKEYRVVEPSRLGFGESVRVHVDAVDVKSGAVYTRSAMVPPFPPETFTSFVSFSSFSSTLMGYMTTLSYYTTSLAATAPGGGLNAGLMLSLALIGLLVFMELSDPAYGRVGERIRLLRRSFTREAAVLLIVFLAMAATKIIFIIYGL